jgi:hypothetical protein
MKEVRRFALTEEGPGEQKDLLVSSPPDLLDIPSEGRVRLPPAKLHELFDVIIQIDGCVLNSQPPKTVNGLALKEPRFFQSLLQALPQCDVGQEWLLVR